MYTRRIARDGEQERMSMVRTVDEESLADAKRIIDAGGLVVIPTDTVYGVTCDPRNEAAVSRIYHIKNRPKFKALQVLLASMDDIEALGLDLPAPLNRLSAAFLPGAFSPIAVARSECTLATVRETSSGQQTQGIRVPNSALSLRILRATGPLAASSANRSGEQSAQSVEEAVAAFGDSVDLYLDGGATQGHVSSTVVAADLHARDGIAIVREGVISQSAIRAALYGNGGGLSA